MFPRGIHNLTDFIHRLDQLDYKNTDWGFRFKNLQAFELGLDNLMMGSEMYPAEMDAAIRKLNFQLDLVILVDQFEEGLIALKNELCLDWIDLWSPTKRHQNYEKLTFTDSLKQILKSHNFFDHKIYQHFEHVFNSSEKPALLDLPEQLNKLQILLDFCNNNPELCHKMWDESHEVLVAERTDWQEPEFSVSDETNDYSALVEYMEQNQGKCAYGAEQEIKNSEINSKPYSCEEKKQFRLDHLQQNKLLNQAKKPAKYDPSIPDAQENFVYDNGKTLSESIHENYEAYDVENVDYERYS